MMFERRQVLGKHDFDLVVSEVALQRVVRREQGQLTTDDGVAEPAVRTFEYGVDLRVALQSFELRRVRRPVAPFRYAAARWRTDRPERSR
jgi:hypothetical protein